MIETVIRCAALAVCTGTVCLLLKKSNPEYSVLLAAAASVAVASAAFRAGGVIAELFSVGRSMMGEAGAYISSVLKCVAIGAVTAFSSSLCRDSSQTALASSIELAGTVSAAAVSVPVLISLLEMIGDMV